MFINRKITLRSASPSDRHKLANLIHFELHVHRHLDWRPPLDWLGHEPFLIAEEHGDPLAALACPPDPPSVAWIRLFAVTSRISQQAAWELLWPEAQNQLLQRPQPINVAAIPLHNWFENLLVANGFDEINRVIMLAWHPQNNLQDDKSDAFNIRPMNLDDLAEVEAIDAAAFGLVWQNSQSSLEIAFRQAAVATVVEEEGSLIAYQISTATPMGGHLARLAVRPEYQGNGIGEALVGDMLSQFYRRGAHTVSVNTQKDNHASISLYQKTGFQSTGEEYPLYQISPLAQSPELVFARQGRENHS
jgi:[ribosomal protein S18]-alanine N-acetyltransferase